MDGSLPASPAIAIIGGGFSGACMALHLVRAGYAGRVVIFEPRAIVGLGLAYSTQDDAHRLNARASRMSMFVDDPAHFTRWIDETGACAGDAQAALPDGRIFARRSVYGAYVAAHVAPLLRDGRLTHVRAAVRDVARRDGGWTVMCEDGAAYEAGIAVLATGHEAPGVPAALAGIAGHPGFVANPLKAGALSGIPAAGRVLIIGTGLTMADAVASLTSAGHTGVITAISRRGQVPRPHAMEDFFATVSFAPPATARALVRQVRAAVDEAVAAGLSWQAVFDALRWRAEDFWRPLPVAERRRMLRHVRPFWDTHRHRLPPPTAAVLTRRLAAGTMRVEAATVTGARGVGGRIEVMLRARGAAAAVPEVFDAVILTAGPGRPGQAPGALSAALLRGGVVAPEPTGQGLACDEDGRAISRAREPALFIVGPPTRGTFADNISVPEVARQVSQVAAKVMKLGLVVAQETGIS